MSRSCKVIFMTVLAFVGLATGMYLALQHGPGVSPDSTVYLEAADNFIRGNGFYSRSRPLTRFPFFYPLLLSLAGPLGMDVFAFSRILHALLFAGNVILLGYLVYFLAGKKRSPAILAGALFVSIGPLFKIHAMAWSEPPFLFLVLLGFLVLIPYVRSGNRRALVAASAVFSLAVLTRYAGVVLGSVVVAAPWILARADRKRRMVDSVVALAVWMTPLVSWILRNMAISGDTVDRQLSLLSMGFSDVRSFFSNLLSFILPETLPVWSRILILSILVGYGIHLWWRLARRSGLSLIVTIRQAPLIHLIILFAGSYIVLLAFSVSFLSANLPLDHRILSPLFVSVLVVLFAMTWRAPAPVRKRLYAIVFSCVAGLLIIINVWTSRNTVSRIVESGAGFSSVAWQDSELLNSAAKLDSTVSLYSNRAGPVWFWTRRSTLSLPSLLDTQSGDANPDFKSDLDRIGTEVSSGLAAVLYFTDDGQRWHEADSTTITRSFEPTTSTVFEDGILFASEQQDSGTR